MIKNKQKIVYKYIKNKQNAKRLLKNRDKTTKNSLIYNTPVG